jgi:hypothetical protein
MALCGTASFAHPKVRDTARLRSEDLEPVAEHQRRPSVSARQRPAELVLQRAAPSIAIRHRRSQKGWKINSENKSVLHRQNGLTLARMSTAVPAIRCQSESRSRWSAQVCARMRCAGVLTSNTRPHAEAQHLVFWGIGERTPPPIFLQNKTNNSVRGGLPGREGVPHPIFGGSNGNSAEQGEGSAIPRKQPSAIFALITMASGDVDESHPI